MGLIDIHSHILPNIDDGAKNSEEAIQLLTQEKENGVSSVVLTPHFYPNLHTLEEYTKNCNIAYESLKEAIRDMELPQIFLGYEVQYFTGISRCQNLDMLCFKNTHYLLLELPFLSPLSSSMLDEIVKINRDLGLTVIIAHIERYKNDRLFKKLLKIVDNQDARAQISADSVFNKDMKKTVIKLLKRNLVSYIATDTHSVSDRPVLIKAAMDEIRHKFHPQLIACIKNSERIYDALKGNSDD
ncbi:MAG: CpsB/CapC family capsule biosynthesis tyrosine phosphatase [Acutalibacteraceae bacterium]|nr:CpsB/CapC family capsule biosynthesis tyrosine phosphatase [Acutalibacteraceae bacterium]